MDVPLNYQISEFDCGPTSVMNAVSFLFPRKKLRPDLIKGIYNYSLDGFNCHGESGVTGTGRHCLQFMASWFNQYAAQRKFPMESWFFEKEEVNLEPEGKLLSGIRRGGAAVILCYLCVPHYVLVTGVDEERQLLYIFDPYYLDTPLRRKDIRQVSDHPMEYNRIIPFARCAGEGKAYYNMGEIEKRCCLMLFYTENLK